MLLTIATIIVALIAGILSSVGGATMTAAITRGGIAFAGTVSLALLMMKSAMVLWPSTRRRQSEPAA